MAGTAYAIKAAVVDPHAASFAFADQKTMYGGKAIAAGDRVFIFASENAGGSGLVASGVVARAESTPRRPDLVRQTPRVSITVTHVVPSRRRLGRAELKPFADWDDGRPETELNFKFYRQATDKIVGLSDAAAEFVQRHF